MKINKIVLAITLALSASSFASVAKGFSPNDGKSDQGHGSVTFIGSINDSPCSINPQSVDQTVNLGSVSAAKLALGGASARQSFDIKLEDCVVDTAKSVTTTFTGQEGANGRLALNGTAKGASIAITTFDGTPVKLGTPTAAQPLDTGSETTTLKFYANLQGDGASGASSAVTPGDFQSVANFTLAYQ